MNLIMSCVDASLYGESVCDHAAFAARTLGQGLLLVHALERSAHEGPPRDLRGSLETSGREALLAKLAALDHEKARLSSERGRELLQAAASRVRNAGVPQVTERLRHGELVEVIQELEPECQLVVIGKRGDLADFEKGRLGTHLERVLRGSQRPVLVASRAFRPPQRLCVAFDGSRTSEALIRFLQSNALLQGLSCQLLAVNQASPSADAKLKAATAALAYAGYAVQPISLAGDPESLIADFVRKEASDLLLMGAYGHSRMRSLILGSTTTALIRSCAIPILVIR